MQLRLSHRTRNGNSDNSRSYPIASLQGFDAAASGPVSFRVGGEAGSLDCSGVLRDRRGAGTCRFQPDERFAAGLERRGVGRATAEPMYQMALGNVRLELLDELARLGYERTTVDNLVEAGIFGIDVPYVREMADSGYRVGSMRRLVEFRIHGVTPAFVREVNQSGLQRASASDLVEARILGRHSRRRD